MAAWQDEVGQHCVTGVVSLAVSDEGSDVHFEAFQVGLHNLSQLATSVYVYASELLLFLSDGRDFGCMRYEYSSMLCMIPYACPQW